MGDMGDYWRDVSPILKEESKKRRKRNQNRSTSLLDENGIKYESKNGGMHLVVDGSYDFWPSTGKWVNRKNGIYKRGVLNLIKEFRVSRP